MPEQNIREKTCCFTGHRTWPVWQSEQIRQRTCAQIHDLIRTQGVRYFGVGGALGYDTLAAKLLFELKETVFPEIKVILVYPFREYTHCWNEQQKQEHYLLLPKYDKTVCVYDHPCHEAYLARNRHLVDHSGFCICYCTRQHSGTAYTVNYAKKCGLVVRNIAEIK